MNNDELLTWVEFVTDKFDQNHSPWVYSRGKGDLKHIRYASDNQGYYHWTKRLKRFIRETTTQHWRPTGINAMFGEPESLWKKLKNWPMMIKVHWGVQVELEDNIPDGQVNGVLTHWEEDGEYIAMFCPYVGREVLKFLRAEPDNPYAENIIKAMQETFKASWGKGEGEER